MGRDFGADIDLTPAVEDRGVEVEPQGNRDAPSVDAEGRQLSTGIEGVELARLVQHADQRGSLMEVVNFDHDFWVEPIVYAYLVTIRPGRIKGWGMHRVQTDRYLVSSGRLRVVLFDGRIGSPTHKRFSEFHFTDETPGLLRIPPGVWHADQNWGDRDVTVTNFPTHPFNRADPDKYRIDPHSGEIPFDWSPRDG
jgi:dTDP-4-dehydrorhamnose 3,5-epimerase